MSLFAPKTGSSIPYVVQYEATYGEKAVSAGKTPAPRNTRRAIRLGRVGMDGCVGLPLKPHAEHAGSETPAASRRAMNKLGALATATIQLVRETVRETIHFTFESTPEATAEAPYHSNQTSSCASSATAPASVTS
jgi:hypothetical protein